MVSYVEKHLIPNETVIYFTRLSWIVYLKALLAFGVGIAFLVLAGMNPDQGNPFYALAGLAFVVGLVMFLSAFIRRRSSEFAVTDKRVIVKVGLVSRSSLEILLSKVEAITVDQGLLGRIFKYGTITIIGTGGTKEPFHLISDPLEFRRQSQIAATTRQQTPAASDAQEFKSRRTAFDAHPEASPARESDRLRDRQEVWH